MVNNRTNSLLKNKEVFDKSKRIYTQILRDSGFKHFLNFELKSQVVPSNRNRKKIIYYNPPFDSCAKHIKFKPRVICFAKCK